MAAAMTLGGAIDVSFSNAQRLKVTGIRLTAGLGPAVVAMSTSGCGSDAPEIFMDALICLLPPLRSPS